MHHGTVHNALTKLRKRRLVEYTGAVHPQTKAKEVQLTADGLAVMGVTNPIGDDDGVTLTEDGSLVGVHFNEGAEADL
jgi:hypothetical protein